MVQTYYRLRHPARSTALAVAALLILLSSMVTQEVAAQTSYACFPTCSETDGRFLSVAGVQLETLAGDVIALTFGSPSTTDSMEIGIFDGETSGYWDSGTIPLEYTLFADSAGDGSGTYQVGQWLGNVMPDNAWFTIRFANKVEARSPNGNYFYTMKIRSTNPAVKAWSNFKIRTNGTVTLRAGQAFAITAPAFTLNDARVIYPRYPSFDTTTYDGTWNFYLDVPAATSFISVWDGDMDHGSYDCVARDTNDPDTPDDVLPAWATGTAAVLEGNARGTSLCPGGGGYATGAPNDDMNNVNRRSPSIMYEVIDPNGNHYANNNPSGNLEWEQFRISTDAYDRNQMDYHADALPAGTYVVKMHGMDMTNLNAWRFFNDAQGLMANEAMGVNAAGDPVPPLRPHAIAGRMFYDLDSNGTFDSGELPMANVQLTLKLDANMDGVVDRTLTVTTDSTGRFRFNNLTSGNVTVSVDSAAVLEHAAITDYDGAGTPGYAAATLGHGIADPTFNFSYVRLSPHVVAGRVYYDDNENGTWDTSEPVMESVAVSLTVDENGDGIPEQLLQTTTDSLGNYRFANLHAGTYSVSIDSAALAADVVPSSDPDGIETPNKATVTVVPGGTDVPMNFSYVRLHDQMVNGTLYSDNNGNGSQDDGEFGIPMVTVMLAIDSDNDGVVDSTLTTVTDAGGSYSFSDLYAGNYTLTVQPSGLNDLSVVSDPDGGTTPNAASFSVQPGSTPSPQNFVYRPRPVNLASYSCFPTCSETDGRFLGVGGSSSNSFVGETVRLELTSLSTTDSLVFAIFDGESGGMWDGGGAPLRYTLYADPNGDGTGTTQVGEWTGERMYDNGWYAIRIPNAASARAATGHYFYTLKVTSSNTSVAGSSVFKVRTEGAVSLLPGQTVGIMAMLSNPTTPSVIYPGYPSLDSSTYDGTWTFNFHLSTPVSSLTMWDGDMDFGSFDGTIKDADDEDTPNETVPQWGATTGARGEGIAHGDPVLDSAGVAIGDTTTASPADDSPLALYARPASVIYEIIDPNGNHYVNENPSGNLEWEQFRIATSPLNREQMDYHAEQLPAGNYQIIIHGMDLGNLNSFRLMADDLGFLAMQFTGTDTSGHPVISPLPVNPDTNSIAGWLFIDANNNNNRETTEAGIPGATLRLNADYNNDGTADATYTTTTDNNGHYQFSLLKNGNYVVKIDTATIESALEPTYTPQNASLPYQATLALGGSNASVVRSFGFQTSVDGSISGADTVAGSSSCNYQSHSTTSGSSCRWRVKGSARIVGSDCGSSVNISCKNFGSFKLIMTTIKNGRCKETVKEVSVAGIDFALFAYDYLYFEGGRNTTTRGTITGNVGVNEQASRWCSKPTLVLGSTCGYSSNRVVMADGTRVVGDYVDLNGSNVSVYDLYANRTTSSTSSARKRHSGPASFDGSVIDDEDLPQLQKFSYGCADVNVSNNSSRTLAPGKYDVITLGYNSTLTLGNGKYYIRSLRGGNRARINTTDETKLYVGRDFVVGDDSYVGSSNRAYFAIRSDGTCYSSATFSLGENTEFHGQVFAPNGEIRVDKGATLTGRFWGRQVIIDENVNVNFFSPVTSLTTANNSGFQKKQQQETAPASSASEAEMDLVSSQPNPFTTETRVHLRTPGGAPATVMVYNQLGTQVRTLLDGVELSAGDHTVSFDGRDGNGTLLPAGVYFCRLNVGGRTSVLPVTLER